MVKNKICLRQDAGETDPENEDLKRHVRKA